MRGRNAFYERLPFCTIDENKYGENTDGVKAREGNQRGERWEIGYNKGDAKKGDGVRLAEIETPSRVTRLFSLTKWVGFLGFRAGFADREVLISMKLRRWRRGVGNPGWW